MPNKDKPSNAGKKTKGSFDVSGILDGKSQATPAADKKGNKKKGK